MMRSDIDNKMLKVLTTRIDKFGMTLENSGIQWQSPSADDAVRRMYAACHQLVIDLHNIVEKVKP